jgi:3-oxoadipate enol-lactonase
VYELEYDVRGNEDGPVLVLSGSLGTTKDLWRPQLPAFSERFTVLRHDHPGHGGSPVPDRKVSVEEIGLSLLGLLDTLGVEQFSACGLSLGGMVSLWLAATAPDRVDRVVLACTGAKLGTPETYADRAALVRRDGVRAVVDGSRDRWFTRSFGTSPEAEQLLEQLGDMNDEGYALCCEAVGEFDYRGELHRVRAPTLVLVGAEDPLTTPEVVETLRSGLADARVVVIPRSAHLASAEQPDVFTELVVRHLQHEERE